MKKNSALLILTLALQFSAHTSLHAKEVDSQVFTHDTEKTAVQFDTNKLRVLEKRLSRFVSDGDTHGLSAILVKDGNVISQTQLGVRNLLEGKPITENTIFRIYSMSKPITGVAMMMLYEEGEFSLDDPVSKFIPEFTGLKVVKSYTKGESHEVEPLKRQPTMRELMSHTAGFAYGLYGDDPSNQAFIKQGVLGSPDLSTFIDRVAAIPLMQQPGERWFYSSSVDIQGAIIERITGLKFSDYLHQRLFTPLNMVDTGFYVPTEKLDRFSDVWGYHPDTKKLQLMPFEESKYNILGDVAFTKDVVGMESGGGGLVSTLDDYSRFCQMLVNKGEFAGVRILKPETVKLMRTNILVGEQKVDISGTLTKGKNIQLGFGLNFGTIKDKESLKSDEELYYWGGAAGTWFWIDPTNNLFFIGMIQRFPMGGPEVDFRGISRKLVYDALLQLPLKH